MTYTKITHDKKFFYKYYGPDAAKIVLQNRATKWSDPSLFNDPFDFQTNFDFSFKMEDLREPLYAEIERLVFGENEPSGVTTNAWFKLLMLRRSNRENITRQEFDNLVYSGIDNGIRNTQNLIVSVKSWWQEFVNNLRVFCVSEVHDDILMWSHYSQRHEGVVIKFKCLPEYDTFLCAAIPVKYKADVPVVANMQEWIKHLTGQIELPFDDLFRQFSTTKSCHWSYEKEWRCIGEKNHESTELFDFIPIMPQEIAAIYLGCKMSKKDHEEILALLSGELSHVEAFKAEKDPYKFCLNFIKIKAGS
ncbi:MAG TPA: DUF2971 domain-containing protein [Candidatus Wujingus californicus]|uniref:DUF2971 domain-containing protein n=1 Tax=Candidatus Wujingus californicus TaxID=3367618 RepID=UPI004024BA28